MITSAVNISVLDSKMIHRNLKHRSHKLILSQSLDTRLTGAHVAIGGECTGLPCPVTQSSVLSCFEDKAVGEIQMPRCSQNWHLIPTVKSHLHKFSKTQAA